MGHVGRMGWTGMERIKIEEALIAGYLGKDDQFDEALTDFATAYARQNERDYKALVRAIWQGRIEVYTESWGFGRR